MYLKNTQYSTYYTAIRPAVALAISFLPQYYNTLQYCCTGGSTVFLVSHAIFSLSLTIIVVSLTTQESLTAIGRCTTHHYTIL
tara:strand:+ start:479 stop:727 length:249 start_codon:yes stop_codon:yes gene_type:complete